MAKFVEVEANDRLWLELVEVEKAGDLAMLEKSEESEARRPTWLPKQIYKARNTGRSCLVESWKEAGRVKRAKVDSLLSF